MRQNAASALCTVLARAMTQDDRVLVLGEQVGRSGGLYGAMQGLLEQFGPERVLDLPIADRGILGVAVGLALGGRRPVVELASTSRVPAILEALAEIGSVAAAGEFAPTMVIRIPCGGEAGPRIDRQAISILTSLEGIQVACASSADQAVGLLGAALSTAGIHVLLEPRAILASRASTDASATLGRARAIRAGRHVTLAAWGTAVDAAVTAAEALAVEGLEAGVIDLVSLSPIDIDTLGSATVASGRLVVVHPDDATVAKSVLTEALDPAFLYLEAPMGLAHASRDAIVAAARHAIQY